MCTDIEIKKNTFILNLEVSNVNENGPSDLKYELVIGYR